MGPQSEGAGGGSECGVSEDTEKAGCGRNSRHTAPAPALGTRSGTTSQAPLQGPKQPLRGCFSFPFLVSPL